ncbi:MAG: DUF4835 family protein [Bacteroidota bacterium]|nr:DUF4835 family protein [Bacteroidota bacterium]MDX5404049.1 DUF4835 family protein [Bacteroidota bacterium]MDX5426622.1 DUF4835 family protein [Bacteroidota bacterium]MDX5448569.1 DUF4835 family protein [Bacteroidota bacterium]MDX5504631.1 DUF4835 family protein [Bacteroidota bacterium]
MNQLLLTLFAFLLCSFSGLAQELRATISILHPSIQRTNTVVFETLERDLGNFMNSFTFTEEKWLAEERVECSFIFNITSYQGNVMTGNLQVQSSRPVYNSTYNTPILNIQDANITFYYQENQPIEFNINNNQSNLTAIMAYYAYVILGMDRDTYVKGGGKKFYTMAQTIVSNSQSGGGSPGWNSFGTNKNRYWLVENLLSNNFDAIVETLYDYHRKGLDLMYDETKQEEAKQTIATSLAKFRDTFQKRPSNYLMQAFFDAKANEIVSIFSGGPQVDIAELKAVLKVVDGSRANRYEDMEG